MDTVSSAIFGPKASLGFLIRLSETELRLSKESPNPAGIIRSADAFGACEVHLVGINYFDPAPAMGSFKWVPARFHDNFAGCFKDLNRRGFTFFTLEPHIGESLPSVRLPNRSAFVLGHEEFGLSFNRADFEGIKSLTVVHMEVPCCSGLVHMAKQAILASGNVVPFADITISTRGEIIDS